jgi:hypothetical protein
MPLVATSCQEVKSLTRDVYVITQITVQRTKNRLFQQKMDQHLKDRPDHAFLLLLSLKRHPSVALNTLKNI